jgi:Ca2+/Na+ antiporter
LLTLFDHIHALILRYTIPTARGRFKHQYVATFILSLVWLGVLSYWMVSWTETIGCILNIDDAVMGVTLLAIGTSTPDCLTSIAIYKTGRGNMAVCNALVCSSCADPSIDATFDLLLITVLRFGGSGK